MKMDAINILAVYTITAVVFLLIDLFWLGIVAKGFYARHLGHLLREQVNWPAAVVFYLVYIAGIQVFVVGPALLGDWRMGHAALLGGMLGFFAYCTFDLTCMALFNAWPLVVTIVDIVWGTLLTAATAATALFVARTMLKTVGMT
ncbi:conserved uncharacterized membrane protein, DUF2177 [Desulfosarcina variabilis str. Montpellier]|uniref:DUF2177 family protein n=1 Tax=Desulfosarcina variabilis TaxID=2300 RepID=UPI003AFA7272